MRRLALLAAATVLISSATASAQTYTFGDWARDRGYEPGDAMPGLVRAEKAGIDSLDGIQDFDWTYTWGLWADENDISSIEPLDFIGLTNLQHLSLNNNDVSSIDPGDFDVMTNLRKLWLVNNQISSIKSGTSPFGPFIGDIKTYGVIRSQHSVRCIQPTSFT